MKLCSKRSSPKTKMCGQVTKEVSGKTMDENRKKNEEKKAGRCHLRVPQSGLLQETCGA